MKLKKKIGFVFLLSICLLGVTGCGDKNTKSPHQIAVEKMEKALKKEGFSLCEDKEYCEEGKSYMLKKESKRNGTEIDVFNFDKLEWRVYITETTDDGKDKMDYSYENVYRLSDNKAEGNLTLIRFMRDEKIANGGITRTVKYGFSNDFEKSSKNLECRVISYNCDNGAFAMLDEGDVRKRNCNIYALELSEVKDSLYNILMEYDISRFDLTGQQETEE